MCSLVSEEIPANLRNKKVLILEKKLLRYMSTSESVPPHPKMHNFGQSELTQPENSNSKTGNRKVTEKENCIPL